MPVPTRLANDGWWLCESPSLAPIPSVPRRVHQGKAATRIMRPRVYLWTGALCICSLVSFFSAIAGYHVARSRDASAKAIPVDISDLISVGPQALPPMDRAFRLRTVEPTLVSRRNCLVERQWQDTATWRASGFEAGRCNSE
jgi:hypothetical protein